MSGEAGRLRILVVDDHADTAEMLKMLFELEGHEVRTAGDAASALDIAARAAFDVVVSDLGLPDRSGLDLMREFRARGIALPGIALSGHGQPSDIAESRAAGFSEHLVKPADPGRLVRAVETLATRSQLPPGSGLER